MDHKSPKQGKSYSEVMNEWAAQQAFVKGNRSRILHPPYHAHPVAKLAGYLVRLLILLIIPAVLYVYMLLQWTGSSEFNTMVSKGLATTLDAAPAETHGAGWQIGGQLIVKSMDATGTPGAFYETLHANTITTRVPARMLFRKTWQLPTVNVGDLKLHLRSGGVGTVPIYDLKDEDLNMEPFLRVPGEQPGPGRTGFLPHPDSGRILAAGYGVDPDFSTLVFDGVQVANLDVIWGVAASAGSLLGTRSEFNRTEGGWKVSATGGKFRQGWMEDWELGNTTIAVEKTRAVIPESTLTREGGGTGKLSAEIVFGEVPEVSGTFKLEEVRLQDLMPPLFAGILSAQASGDLRISGSTNRSTGISTEGSFVITSGRVGAIPIFSALQRITGESQFAGLPLKGATFTLKSGGLEASAGYLVEVPAFSFQIPNAKVEGNFRYERSRPLGTILNGEKTSEKVNLSGVIRIGFSPAVAGRFHNDVAAKYLTKGDDGWMWLECKFSGAPDRDITASLAADMLLMSGRIDN